MEEMVCYQRAAEAVKVGIDENMLMRRDVVRLGRVPVMVTRIDSGVVSVTDGRRFWNYVGTRDLKDVSLSVELLQRLCWLKVEKKRDDASSYMCICNKQATVKWFWGGHYRGWLWLCNDDEGTMLTLGRCNKMRELQHALKNCGLADVCEQMADHMLAMNYPSEDDDSTEAVGGPSADASGTAAGPGGEAPGTGATEKR